MSEPTTAGGTATYAIEVVNEGSATAQFAVALVVVDFQAALSLTSGSLDITPLAEDTTHAGYYTNPIAPGKNQTLTLKVTTPTNASKTDKYETSMALSDTAGDHELSNLTIDTTIKAAPGTGTGTADIYTTTPGGAYVLANSGTETTSAAYSLTTAEAIKPTGKAKFTAKIENDRTAPGSIHLTLASGALCGVAFPITAKVGTTDVTAALENGTFGTPELTHGKSVTIAISIGVPAETRTNCYGDYYDLRAIGGGVSSSSEMVVNLIARLPSLAT
jgi:hypothetical protein